MQGNSPPRVAGYKRAAVNSPAITPPGTKRTDPVVLDGSDALDTELKPSRLEEKFGKPPKKKSSSTTDVQGQEGEDEGGEINLLDQQEYEALIQEPPPPTPAQYLQYDFDETDEFTSQNMAKYNGCKLEDDMRAKTLKCKQQDRSQAHPKWGPFRLSPSPLPEVVEIINSKGKKAFSFLAAEYLLGTGEFSFDTEEFSTYRLLCYAGPKLVLSQLHRAQQLQAIDKTILGPFQLSRHETEFLVICISFEGKVFHSFDLSTTTLPQDSEWIPVGQRGTYTHKKRISFGKTLPPASNQLPGTKHTPSPTDDTSNRFSPLVDEISSKRKPPSGERHHTPCGTASYSQAEKAQQRKLARKEHKASIGSDKAARSSGESQSHNGSKSDDEDNKHESEEDEEMEQDSKGDDEELQSGDNIDLTDPTPKEPVIIEITPHVPEWNEEDSDGEAARSGDEKTPPKKNL